jgi:hypothetical protein
MWKTTHDDVDNYIEEQRHKALLAAETSTQFASECSDLLHLHVVTVATKK